MLVEDAKEELNERERQFIETNENPDLSEKKYSGCVGAGVTSPYGRSQPQCIRVKMTRYEGMPIKKVNFASYIRTVMGSAIPCSKSGV